MAILICSVAVAVYFGGFTMLTPASMGAITVTSLCLRRVPLLVMLAFAAILSVCAGLAAYVGNSALYLPLVTGLTAIAVIPFTARFGTVVLSAPLMPAVIGMQHHLGSPFAVIAVVAASAVLFGLLLPLTKMSLPQEKMPWQLAWVHGLLLAVLSAVGMSIVLRLGWGHGFWLLIGICMVLLPVRGKARQVGMARVAGSVAGAILAELLSLISLQPAFLLSVAGIAYVIGIAYSVEGNQPVYITFLTLGVIMIAATGIGPIWELGVERVVLITAGAAAALLVTEYVLHHFHKH